MKRILITGQNSYIGNSFENWVAQWPNDYKVEKVSLRNMEWLQKDWSTYDVIYHVVGIAHQKETKDSYDSYFTINRDLTIQVAQKAKKAGIKDFIFLSTMSIYGKNIGVINCSTEKSPRNAYGKSKLEAEEMLSRMQDQHFKLTIIRPPMVYGKGCKGNYVSLSKFAKKVPIFPKIANERSMIFIDNLSEFVKNIIDLGISGEFHPQNIDYVCTSDMVKIIREEHNGKLKRVSLFNSIIKSLNFSAINKVFGNLVYDKKISSFDLFDYQIADFEKSIKITEGA
ncbi:NAD-dependent epimerase/dehydratase family protein [Aerococcus urinaeequi]|uniref:NAD-dependent epimerase/dehydratase family protein n=1 Tax=Aerococcus urinaeequi TaxID=51665 RepID=UPI003D6A0F9E